MIVHTDIVRWFRASAITLFPFIFIANRLSREALTLKHEAVHYRQQRAWALYGLGVGLLVYLFLYLLCLPVGWNPLRARWEREAFKLGEGYCDNEIDMILRGPPYYLWRM